MAELSVIGLNHRTAAVEVREQLALPGDLAQRLLAAIHAEPALEEALVLATCNRTELYSVPHGGHDPLEYFLAHVARLKGTAPISDRSVFYRYDGLAAARHLFRVTASLDSQIVGEHQILGQVKEAYRLAVEARTAGFLINKLLHRAFRVGKRVQAETQLGRGSAGIAPAAVELARQIFSSLDGKTVLLIGAGQMAESAARTLLLAGAARLIVANRTLYRAQQLAYDLVHKPDIPASDVEGGDDAGETDPPITCPAVLAMIAEEEGLAADAPQDVPQAAAAQPAADAIGLEEIAAILPQVDLIISSTGSPEPVLTFGGLAGAIQRRNRPVFIVDIAVPRDVDERLGDLDNVFLYNIDDLNRLVERNLERRRQEIPRAEAIVDDELRDLEQWLASLEVAPTIRLLAERLEALRTAHIDRYGKKFTDADREQLERFTQTLGNQFLHKPLEFLRKLSENGTSNESLATIETVRRLFGLDAPSGPRP